MYRFGWAAALGFLVTATAIASDSMYERTDEAAASTYLSVGFGGNAPETLPLQMGFRINIPDTHAAQPVPPLLQFNYSTATGGIAHVIGVPVARQRLSLGQYEEDAMYEEEVAAERGWFDYWDFDFDNYTWKDWTMLTGTAVVIGVGAAALLDDDDSEPAGDGGNGGNGGNGGTPCEINPIPPLPGVPPGCTPTSFLGSWSGQVAPAGDPEHAEWLNAGTGQMGDIE